jgi:hypothetical protein
LWGSPYHKLVGLGIVRDLGDGNGSGNIIGIRRTSYEKREEKLTSNLDIVLVLRAEKRRRAKDD